MKALSIRQPWVHAILYFGKRCENRDWDPSGGNISQARRLVGQTIFIHAGKGCTIDEYEGAGEFMRDVYALRPWEGSTILPALKSAALIRGAIVGSARLAEVVYTTIDGHRWDGREDLCKLCGRNAITMHVGSSPGCPRADPWAIPGCIGLILADVEPIAAPIPFKGALGFFDVPREVIS